VFGGIGVLGFALLEDRAERDKKHVSLFITDESDDDLLLPIAEKS
jgi:hypothetical protein